MCRALHGVWHRDRAAPGEPADATAAEILLRSGCGPVVAWAGRDGGDARFRASRSLAALEHVLVERDIERLALELEAAGVSPFFLVKGWTLGPSYPVPDLRPCGDIDLVVDPARSTDAGAVARRISPALRTAVDVHRGFGTLLDRPFADVAVRSRPVRAGAALVRVPCLEDHARIVALHLLRHGAFRPLWLLDLAILVDAGRARLEWSRLLAQELKLTAWVRAAILLARSLLGLDLSGTPLQDEPAPPGWLEREVLSRWSRTSGYGPYRVPLAAFSDPRRVLREWRDRVPSPIQASLRFGAPPNAWPRWPLQAAEFVLRLKDKPRLVARHLRARLAERTASRRQGPAPR